MMFHTDYRKRRRNRRIKAALCLAAAMAVAVGIGYAVTSGTDAEEGEKSPSVSAGPKEPAQKPEPQETKANEPGFAFDEFYFYEQENAQRYLDYQTKHPELSAEDVVWRVDAGLDQPFYTGIEEIADVSAKPLVPNKYHKLPDDFVPENLVKLPSGRQATADTKAAYDQMRKDAAPLGIRISEGSAYRSIDYQKEVYARYVQKDTQEVADTYSSRPGHSDHHTGEAIDLLGRDGTLTGFGGTEDAAWLAKHAYEYGFVIRFPEGMDGITGYVYEPWHIRYVGKETAQFMKENGISTLEEYQVKYIDHTPPKTAE